VVHSKLNHGHGRSLNFSVKVNMLYLELWSHTRVKLNLQQDDF
jgi:hypothetical protein